MNEKQQRGGRAFHSILEAHFDFIREQRQRRKTWQEIADLLLSEKGIRVTLYAPYHFYRRKLKRSRQPHWEDEPIVSRPTRPIEPASRAHRAPLPAPPTFKRPNPQQYKPEDYQ